MAINTPYSAHRALKRRLDDSRKPCPYFPTKTEVGRIRALIKTGEVSRKSVMRVLSLNYQQLKAIAYDSLQKQPIAACMPASTTEPESR